MKNNIGFFLLIYLTISNLSAQDTIPQRVITGGEGSIKGRIFDPINNEAVPFANVLIQGTTVGTTSDDAGNYQINNLLPGLYNVQASAIGFKTALVYEVEVSNARTAIVDLRLEANSELLKAIEVKADPFSKTEESPVSLRNIGVNEIKRNPGGNRDISKVIQSLPGVASTPASFRNDILIRGGSPSENRFFIDGIEIPTINHFSTQGASGGPVGTINVDFVREVDFYSGAFPASRGNSLSSIFDFKFKEGNPDRLTFNFNVGSSDMGITFDGPMGKKANYIFSFRRSYLQFLFKALALPFLPTYNDAQFKIKYNIDAKNSLTFLGIGAIDDFELNLDANETEEQRFILNNIPVNNQWNYTVGVKYTNFRKNSYTNVVLSRSHLNNKAFKYLNNDESSEQNLLLDYDSEEVENKFRAENISRIKGFKITAGIGYELGNYKNNTFQQRTVGDSLYVVDYNTKLNLHKWYAFGQVSKGFFTDRLRLSFGLRADANDYSEEMSNLFEQISPRFSANYNITPNFSINFNTGLYYQHPVYTILGFSTDGNLTNKENDLKYIAVSHLVGGIEWNTPQNTRITLEGYYKRYNNYPFSVVDSISLANLGGDFGVVGNEEVSSTSEGRTYGMELLIQQRLFKGFYGIASYTLGWSEFQDKNGRYVPTSWDARHIVNLTVGKKFKRNWELGLKWRFSTGSPYSPYDVENSALISIWNANNAGVFDYNNLNTARIESFHQLDVRLDKKWFFKKWSLNLFLDIQNAYNYVNELAPNLTVVRDEAGAPVIDPDDPSRYLLKELVNENGTLLPSIGIVVEL